MIKFLDINSFCKGLKEVTSTSMITRNNDFDQNGLFSELIFLKTKPKIVAGLV